MDQKPGETDDIAPAPPRLPDGTQVVLRVTVYDTSGAPVRGATGRVTGDAGRGRYKVTLADGRVLVVGRDQLGVRRADQHATALAGLGPAPGEGSRLVRERTAYAAVVGSRAFGLAGPEPDTDLRGVYVAPAGGFFSLVKPPTHVEGPEHERFSWELERFCELALKANPNVLEVLHSPQVRTRTPVGAELLDLRGAFLSQLAYQTYSGYVLSQFKRIEADLRRDGAPKWKHVMHLLRLLVAARDLLASGRLVLDVSAERDRLLAVRAGQMRWAEVGAWRRALQTEVDEAFARTPLPPGPDAPRVDAWLRSVRGRDIRGELDLRLLPETP